MRFSIRSAFGQAIALFLRHGVWICAEFIALGLMIDCVFLLMAPEQTGLILGNDPAVNTFQFGTYYIYLITSSLVMTLLYSHQFLRLWLLSEIGVAEPAVVWVMIRTTLAPLLIINLVIDVLYVFSFVSLIFLSVFVFALSLMILPAILVERRGWGAVARNFEMIRGIWGKLLTIAAILLVTLIVVTVMVVSFASASFGIVEEGLPLIVYTTITDLPSTLISALTLCLILVIYRWIIDQETGRDLPDIFR